MHKVLLADRSFIFPYTDNIYILTVNMSLYTPKTIKFINNSVIIL